jgi:hypothetical protein
MGACSLEVDLGCESGIGRTCATGLVCVADRCERSCTGAAECPSDGECRAVSSGGAMFCFDARTPADGGVPSDAPDASTFDAGQSCAVKSVCFQRTGAACAVDCTGSVWCWGQQHAGRLGNGVLDGPALTTPTPVIDQGHHPLTEVDSLACGDGFSCVHVAMGSSAHAGHVLCWGYEATGAFNVSLGTAVDLTTPLVAASMQVSAATRHACMLDTSVGDVLCFGLNDGLVDPSMPDDAPFSTPVSAAGGVSGALSVQVATFGACAVMQTGGVQCWGDNSLGQAGHTPIDAVTGWDPNVGPTQVTTSAGALGGVADLAVGYGARAVLDASGALLTWGGNQGAELGDDLSWTGEPCDDARAAGSTCRSRAMAPSSAPTMASVASYGDANTSCGVVAATRHVLCWGDNLSANAGIPAGGRAWIARDEEVRIEGTGAVLDAVRDVFVGAENGCAVRDDGSLWCWGSNVDGQLARAPDAVDRLAVPITFPR